MFKVVIVPVTVAELICKHIRDKAEGRLTYAGALISLPSDSSRLTYYQLASQKADHADIVRLAGAGRVAELRTFSEFEVQRSECGGFSNAVGTTAAV